MSETERQQSRTQFRHEQIDANPPCSRLGFCLTTDLTGNGLPDVIVGGAGQGFPARDLAYQLDRDTPLPVEAILDVVGIEHTNLFWYENPGWERHDVAFVPNLDVGATLCDVTGDGRQNVVAGQGINNTDVYWFEMPDDPREPWTPHLVTDTFEKYHDLAAGDVDGDGADELVGLSQESETVFYYDIPEDPTVVPWPESCLHIVDRGIEIEGLRIRDIDHDGQSEIIAGTYVYHRDSGAATGWRRDPVVTGWDDTRVELADLDGDGDLEVIFSEGDSPHYGTHPGRVAVFDGPEWTGTILEDGLFCPHTLQVADFDGDGNPDIYVAEMGLGQNDDPVHLLFRNRGDGTFDKEVASRGIETHEAVAVDMTGDGRMDIVGKSYAPDHHVDVWYNEN
ncbi:MULTISPECIES: FG-GAP repeat domain-containing protein [Haloarcula]|uniref:FG-GAP repeat domain-containing protein n=1 Tax=Haloarcula TaxID=2237 RepID=UPI0023EA8C1E|nr:VCBS repeat-containing protein [Halomicroarcula sp. XH51]